MNLYALAGQSRSLLFIYLIEKNKNGFFLYKVDVEDRNIVGETWHGNRQEALDQANTEIGDQKLEWKEIPVGVGDSISHIFDWEPRLTIVIAKPEKNTIPLIIKLIWVDFILSSIADTMNMTKIPYIGAVGDLMPMSISPMNLMLVYIALNFVFTIVMNFKIGEGVQWGRTTYALSCLLTLPELISPGELFSVSKIAGLLTLCQGGIEIYALVLLYTGFGKEWFKKK